MREIARAAYAKYVPRIGREPSPMVADYDAAVAAQHATVIEIGGQVGGYIIAWPEDDAYFIENIGVDPQYQGHGLGRRLIEHAAAEARRHGLAALRRGDARQSVDVRTLWIRRDAPRDRGGISPRLYALDIAALLKGSRQVAHERVDAREGRPLLAIDRNDRQAAEALPVGQHRDQCARSQFVLDMAFKQPDDAAAGKRRLAHFHAH